VSKATENKDIVCLGSEKATDPRDIYDPVLADEICEHLANGLSLSVICANVNMPSRTTIYKWRKQHEDFADNYARARQVQADTFADQIQDIADCVFLPPAHKAAMIDARKWRAARQNWRAWGDKVQHEHTARQPAIEPGELPGALGFLALNGKGNEEGSDEVAG
jgi:hypothetical protein